MIIITVKTTVHVNLKKMTISKIKVKIVRRKTLNMKIIFKIITIFIIVLYNKY